MANTAFDGKPYVGNPHVRSDEGDGASARPRRSSLLYKKTMLMTMAFVPFAGFAALDELGKTPYHWFTMNGSLVQKGTVAFDFYHDSTGEAEPKFVENSRAGLKAGVANNYFWGPSADNHTGSGSCTIFGSLRLGVTASSIFEIGARLISSSKNISLYTDGSNGIRVFKWTATGCATESQVNLFPIVYLPDASTTYHTYALVYNSTDGKLTFYIDGNRMGTCAFDGFNATDVYQFNGFYGGGGPGYRSDTSFIEDFRIYQEALTAENLATLADKYRTTGEPAKSPTTSVYPYYWYAFNGAVQRHSNVLPSNGNADLVCTEFSRIREGVQAGKLGTSNWNNSQHMPTGSFTIFLSCDPGTTTSDTEVSPVYMIGTKTTTTGQSLGFVRIGKDAVGIAYWNNSAYSIILQASVTHAVGTVHAYAIIYDGSTGKLTLYVDGEAKGVCDYTNNFTGEAAWQFGSVHGGLFSGMLGNTTYRVEDFRLYDGALSAADVTALAEALRDGHYVDGAYPYFWLQWGNNSVTQMGTATLNAYSWINNGVSFTGAEFVEVRDGVWACSKAPNAFSSGGAQSFAADAFTLCLSARARANTSNQHGVLFEIGKNTSTTNLAIAAYNDEMRLCRWNGGTLTQLVQCSVPNHDRDFHAYVVTWNGTTLSFYVDGALKGTTTSFTMFGNSDFQFGSMHGGGTAGLTAGQFCVEDFRYYKSCLTETQIQSYSETFSAWPKADKVWLGGETFTGTETDMWRSWNSTSWTNAVGSFASTDTLRFDRKITLTQTTPSDCAGVNFAGGVKWVASGAVEPPNRLFRGPSDAVFQGYDDEYVDFAKNCFFMGGSTLCFGRKIIGLRIILR